MAKLSVFLFISLDGYYKDINDGFSWHRHGGEESEFSAKSSQQEHILLFGRITYDVMASFWPTPMAIEQMPDVANGMNRSEKIVFSKTINSSDWNNTRFFNGNLVEEVKKLKQGKLDITVLGSGTILTQLADAGLIDTYQFMIDPVALGSGTAIFSGLKQKLDLELTDSNIFKSGIILATYKPMV